MEKFERIFSPKTLIILNVIFIASTLMSGTLFVDTGLIHAFGAFFVILSLIRIWVRYNCYDQFLEKFFQAAVIMFLVFTLSHVIEFFSYRFLHLSDNITFTNVVNFHIVGLLILIIGTERFLHLYDRRSSMFIWILSVISAAFVIPVVGLYMKDGLIDLGPDKPWLYVYIAVSIIVATFAMSKIGRLGRLVSISSNFVMYVRLAIISVTSSILINLFYGVLKESLLKAHQIIYLSHFLFYAGMCLIFLAFGTLENLKKIGFYSIAQELKNRKLQK